MYARHIDQLDQLGDLVAKIINKHVALQILPEHYPIVGACLLRAIAEVLGEEIATPEVMSAWGAAYGQLADILIGAETSIYDQKEQAVGGWRGGAGIHRRGQGRGKCGNHFVLLRTGRQRPDSGGRAGSVHRHEADPRWRRNPPQLLAVGPGQQRSVPHQRQARTGGRASNFLHDQLHVGASIQLFPPSGEFTLTASDKPLVLISGGVGITPTLAMLEAALETERPVHFIHCARNGSVHAFRDWIDELAERHPQLKRFYCYAEDDGVSPAAHKVGMLIRHCWRMAAAAA
jgi:nitric oxide dioxygenase